MKNYSGTILYYTPLKGNSQKSPSGDQTIAASFWKLFESLGFDLEIASFLKTREPIGDLHEQKMLKKEAEKEVNRLLLSLKTKKPKLWVTYHHYYKAPDLLGPFITKEINIPYLLIEASLSPLEKDGKWQNFYQNVLEGFKEARLVISLNPKDHKIIQRSAFTSKQILLSPFLNNEFKPSNRKRELRYNLAFQKGLNPSSPWLLVVGQMREGAKMKSYDYLAQALNFLKNEQWQMIIIGDGLKGEVQTLLRSFQEKIFFLGEIYHEEIKDYYESADIFLWPGIGEAIGMCYLEAQAMGLPVIMDQKSGGSFLIAPNKTGFLAENPQEFALLLDKLLMFEKLRNNMGQEAFDHIKKNHSFEKAQKEILDHLKGIL